VMTKKIVIKGVPLNRQARALELLHHYIGNYATSRPNGNNHGVCYVEQDLQYFAYQTKTSYIIAHYSRPITND